MNPGRLLFLGLFTSMAVSWVAFILAPQLQLGNLRTGQDRRRRSVPVDYPNNLPGMARQGAEVYRANGCAYCHTEQVRPAALGSDLARGWGVRRSVAHDYIFDQTVMLGAQRIGPTWPMPALRMDANAVLCAPLGSAHSSNPHSIMPPFRYLFDVPQNRPRAVHQRAGGAAQIRGAGGL